MSNSIKGIIEYYNQHGEGVAFYNSKPVYIYGTIKDEEVEFEIQEEFKTYYIGSLIKILKRSPHRIDHNILNAHLIGGYDLIHMNYEEQKKFKIEKVFHDFKKIAQIDLKDFEWFEPKKKIKYRNKITVHDGYFYQKKSNTPIEIDDFLLSDIKWDRKKLGTIIYRQLDTLIYGDKKSKIYTTDSMLGYKFFVGLNSFYQVNKEIAEKAYDFINKNVVFGGKTLDLYSGIGTISIISSKNSQIVHGIEVDKNSYQDALKNQEVNNIKNVLFFNLSVEKYIKSTNEQFDTVILDPPRKGVDKKTIEIIKNIIKPKRIIYMSCNPATQAANINHLKEKYCIDQFVIMDMFPQTYHIETIAVLNLKK